MTSCSLDQIGQFCALLASGNLNEIKSRPFDGIYARSLEKAGQSFFFLAKIDGVKLLVEYTQGDLCGKFDGELSEAKSGKLLLCERRARNARALREVLPFTRPVSLKDRKVTIGCGDRLGIATPGHVGAIRDYQASPMLAQQSVRELNFTGRTFQGVVDDASWGVFQENYREGFGADGDHLKDAERIEGALGVGMTFLTLDLSDHIDNQCANLDAEAMSKAYRALPVDVRKHYEDRYIGKTFSVPDGVTIEYTEAQLARIVLVYHKAIEFAKKLNEELLSKTAVDLEISIDETETPTHPTEHFLFANEVIEAGVRPVSLAPRFCGEFQKGIDYIGQVPKFESEFRVHAAIAKHFDYKVSVHSGSDKFSIFPYVGKYTDGRFHLKTAGTSWLQAMLLVARKDPALYRAIHDFCLKNHGEALKFYHITADFGKVPPLSSLSDEQLPGLFEQIELRQLIHICYGLVLNAKEEGRLSFRDDLYALWNREEGAHDEIVASHIRRHLETLGVPKK